MICTVTTLKDTLAHVIFFVEGNLAQGVDLMFVFWEGTDREVEEFLDGHPHVYLIRDDAAWWGGSRPDGLNARQRINAYFVSALLSAFDWAEWVFHVDGDEIVLIDRAVLAAVPPSVRAVKLAPLESVSEADAQGRASQFKRLLDDDELLLLQALGMVEEAANTHYFHGHVNGKSGIRPAVDIRLGAHVAVDPAGKRVPYFESEQLRHLHYESDSAEEFARKWATLIASGPVPAMRKNRRPVAGAVAALSRMSLPEDTLLKYLTKVYLRTTADDVRTLRELGLLETVDPTVGGHTPRRLPEKDMSRLGAAVTRLAGEPRQTFHSNEDPEATRQAVRRSTTGF